MVFLDQVCSHVESLLNRNDVAFCHNDLWYGNFLAAKGVPFIDLEMAGRGDIYFDLISFVHCHHLENEQTRIFLDAYAEVSGFYPSKKVMRMRVALHLHEGLWGFTKAHNGFSDPYHSDWGAQHLNALREL